MKTLVDLNIINRNFYEQRRKMLGAKASTCGRH
jgi:hypothetical protein